MEAKLIVGAKIIDESKKHKLELERKKAEADRLHKLTKKEENDFNEFQQQREKLNRA